MKVLFIGAILALSLVTLYAQAPAAVPTPEAPKVSKQTPITDSSERLKIFDMFAEGQQLQEKMQAVSDNIAATQLGKQRADLTKQADEIQGKINKLNAQISDSPLGTEMGELQKQGKALQDKFTGMVTPILAAHGCPDGSLTPALELKNCAPKPQQAQATH